MADGGAPAAKSGNKVLLILGIIAGIGVLVCCGGAGVFVYKAQPKRTTVAAEVAAISNSILPMEVDRDLFEPAHAEEANVPFIADVQACMWKVKDGEGGMQMVRLRVKIPQNKQSQEQLDQQMQQALSQGGNQDHQLPILNISKSDEVELTVLGQTCTFREIHGKRSKSEVEYRELTGHVRDGEFIVVIKIQVEADKWDDEKIKAMIASAK